MRRLLACIRRACRPQRGSTTPMMMMMSSLLAISGSAFLSVAVFHNRNMEESVDHIQAQYHADQAVQKVKWRIGHTAPPTWEYWSTFSDSNATTILDTALNRLTIIGHYGDASDTLYVFLNVEPAPVDTIKSIITYGGTITVIGDEGVLSYPVDFAPDQVAAPTVLDVGQYKGLATHFYRGNTVLQGDLTRGIHFIEGGDVVVDDGTTLEGAIFSTGSITLVGGVSINAVKAPGDTSYYPALASMGSIYTQPEVVGVGGVLNNGGAVQNVDNMVMALGAAKKDKKNNRMNRRERLNNRRENRRERLNNRRENRRERLNNRRENRRERLNRRRDRQQREQDRRQRERDRQQDERDRRQRERDRQQREQDRRQRERDRQQDERDRRQRERDRQQDQRDEDRNNGGDGEIGLPPGTIKHLSVNGLVYAMDEVYLDASTVNGVLLGQNIHLRGPFNVTYTEEFAVPSPGLKVGSKEYKAKVGAWIEKEKKEKKEKREKRHKRGGRR